MKLFTNWALIFSLSSFLSCSLDKVEDPGPQPMAGFTITNGNCVAPCSVIFTNNTVDAVSFEWDFGDGTPKSGDSNPTHSYTLPGDYLVKLTAFGSGGAVDTETKALTISTKKFERTFGGAMNDSGSGIMQNTDGSYLIIGTTYSSGAGNSDIYLLKVKEDGTQIPITDFDLGGINHDTGFYISAATDKTYAVATGEWWVSTSQKEDLVFMKLSTAGAIITPPGALFFGGAGHEQGVKVKPTADGGYIILGITDAGNAGGEDIYLIKTDADGNKIWENSFGLANDDFGLDVAETSSGGFAVIGISNGIDIATTNAYLLITDALGQFISQVKYPNTYYGTSIISTTDGGFVATMSYLDNFGDLDTKLVKVTNSGAIVWEKVVASGSGGDLLYATALSTGGYILTGYTSSTGAGKKDVMLVKTDADGNIIWSNLFGGTMDDEGVRVIQTADGGFMIVGSTKSFGAGAEDVYLIKTDKNGNSQ